MKAASFIFFSHYIYKYLYETLREQYQILKNTNKQYEQAIDQEMKRQIQAHVKRTHNYDELECEVIAPLDYFLKRTSLWITYVPLRKRPGYTLYKKTCTMNIFLDTWDVPTNYNFTGCEGNILQMEILVNSKSPVRAIYNPTKKKLIITFWYEPIAAQQPQSPDCWQPQRKIQQGNRKRIDLIVWERHQAYWKEKILQ